MKIGNKILSSLREAIKLSDLDDELQRKIVKENFVTKLTKCCDCGQLFDSADTVGVRTNMEDLYGVSDEFPDGTYDYLDGCPYCESIDIEDLGLYDYNDFEDKDLFKESKWTHLSGPKYGYMDEKQYQFNIIKKLIPMLNKYDIELFPKAFVDKPGKQTYIGKDLLGKKIRIIFYNAHKDKMANREGKYDMLVEVSYDGNREEAGVIDLTSEDAAEQAFSLITMTLENLGFTLDGDEPLPKEAPKEDEELEKLSQFRESLTEQEALELLDYWQ